MALGTGPNPHQESHSNIYPRTLGPELFASRKRPGSFEPSPRPGFSSLWTFTYFGPLGMLDLRCTSTQASHVLSLSVQYNGNGIDLAQNDETISVVSSSLQSAVKLMDQMFLASIAYTNTTYPIKLYTALNNMGQYCTHQNHQAMATFLVPSYQVLNIPTVLPLQRLTMKS